MRLVGPSVPASCCCFFATIATVGRLVSAKWQPEQISVAYGGIDTDDNTVEEERSNKEKKKTVSMNVQWVTSGYTQARLGTPVVDPNVSLIEIWPAVGESQNEKEKTVVNHGTSFTLNQSGNAWWTFHRHNIQGLLPGTSYHYQAGNPVDGWSQVHTFKTINPWQHRQTYFLYGDLEYVNERAVGYLEADLNRSAGTEDDITATLHVGDFAYNLFTNGGKIGDAFMKLIEPLSAARPYMVLPGNHEGYDNFVHYTYRFSHMPCGASPALPSSGRSPFPFPPELPNNWYYSWEVNNTHFVFITTEIYGVEIVGDDLFTHVLPMQYEWLQKDLASVDRSRIDFVVVMGHRPLYVSRFLDAYQFVMRDGILGKYALEPVFKQYNVDLYVSGHVHAYERMSAVYKDKEVTPYDPDPASGGITHVIRNPGAPVYIISATPGNQEDHNDFYPPYPDFSYVRSMLYGYSKLKIYNRTHLYMEHIGADTSSPETLGKVIDYVWIIKE